MAMPGPGSLDDWKRKAALAHVQAVQGVGKTDCSPDTPWDFCFRSVIGEHTFGTADEVGNDAPATLGKGTRGGGGETVVLFN